MSSGSASQSPSVVEGPIALPEEACDLRRQLAQAREEADEWKRRALAAEAEAPLPAACPFRLVIDMPEDFAERIAAKKEHSWKAADQTDRRAAARFPHRLIEDRKRRGEVLTVVEGQVVVVVSVRMQHATTKVTATEVDLDPRTASAMFKLELIDANTHKEITSDQVADREHLMNAGSEGTERDIAKQYMRCGLLVWEFKLAVTSKMLARIKVKDVCFRISCVENSLSHWKGALTVTSTPFRILARTFVSTSKKRERE
tara:strand:+ start:194 stop:967 length:774 start_codon:yes stop_codon:yes gene_type:complete